MKISLLIIATNKYIIYLQNLINSADQYFLKSHKVHYNIFTDKVEEVEKMFKNRTDVSIHKVIHQPFPYTTLYRFHFFKEHYNSISNFDQYVYIDSDCLIKSEINDEIIGDIVPVMHCGYVKQRGTYETNKLSTSYVKPTEGNTYYGGGFWSFSKIEFWKFVNKAIEMIEIDKNNNIIPVWHDESVLNRYLIDNNPSKVLSPSYHYPQNNKHIYGLWKNANVNYNCKILLLDKNHSEMRNEK